CAHVERLRVLAPGSSRLDAKDRPGLATGIERIVDRFEERQTHSVYLALDTPAAHESEKVQHSKAGVVKPLLEPARYSVRNELPDAHRRRPERGPVIYDLVYVALVGRDDVVPHRPPVAFHRGGHGAEAL